MVKPGHWLAGGHPHDLRACGNAVHGGIFFKDRLGLLLYTKPVPNSELARTLVGRMGIVPSGVAENFRHGVRPERPATCAYRARRR